MTITSPSSFLDAVRVLAPQIQASVEDSEQTRQLHLPLVEAMAQAGLYRLWIPRTLGGEEADPMTFVRVVEAVAQVDGATGWCLMIGGGCGIFGGYLPAAAARAIYGSDPLVITGGAFRPLGQAVVVEGGYRVTGRWLFGSGCQHCAWLVGGCRIFDGEQPRLQADGTPVTRILFFPTATCEILDTWYTAGLRGTGSHDYAVAELFVPAAHALSFREPPVQPGPLYALPTLALLTTAVAAVPLGIARHAIDTLVALAGSKSVSRSPQVLSQHAMVQADIGRAEALLRSGRAFLYETLSEAWQVVTAGELLTVTQRAMLWLAATQATTAAMQAVDLMFRAGGSASIYTSSPLERCVRDIRTAGQHVSVVPSNYEMVGQALLGFDMRTTLLAIDDRSAG
jgi:alkylation response protein AidB-like acyl-CoA dehydrogenase